MNIYVENLHGTIDNAKLNEIFTSYEGVQSEVVKDIFTGVSSGSGCVEMDDKFAQSTISVLDQTILSDLKINVKQAPAFSERMGLTKPLMGL